MEQGYSIKDLEVLSGIKAHTIRIWEKRYKLLKPSRTDTNIRYYSDEDLRRMLNVSLLVKNGFKISKVSKWEDVEIKEKVLNVSESKTSETDYVDRLMLYMLNFDNTSFIRLTNEIMLKLGFEESVFKVFFTLFQRIGTYWQVGTIFTAQEHFVSNIFRQKLIAEIDKLEVNDSKGKTILFFLPERELHELSLLFYSYLAQKSGYNVVYLGQLMPLVDLEKTQRNLQIDFVFTAFINSITKEDLENYLIQLKDIFQKQKVFVTGWQIQKLEPQLPRNVKSVKDYTEFRKFLG
ncbi:MerR family transcriptional regulator [Draconibacterium sp.]|nr:MerR family transcriptional regulator [Draconibacterium sp.]